MTTLVLEIKLPGPVCYSRYARERCVPKRANSAIT